MDLKELKQQAKFQKKDILFSEVLGVCRVDELTRLSTQKGDMILYYGLRSIADQTKVSYVPVENHSVLLRELVTVEEAKRVLAKAAEGIDPLLIQEAQYVINHFDK